MRTIVILAALAMAPATSVGQLSGVLEGHARGELQSAPPGLAAFAAGNYEAALEALRRTPEGSVPHHDRFTRAALLYQRDRERVLQLRDEIDLPARQSFYLRHPPMTASLDGETSVPLTVVRFPATLMGGEEVTMLLDTGGSGVGIDQELVEQFEMPHTTEIETSGTLPFVGGIVFEKHPVVIPELSIGKLELRNVPAEYAVFSEEEQELLDRSPLPDYDIIVGLDTFIGFVDEIRLDRREGTITFSDTPELTEGGIPFLFHASKPFTAFRGGDEWWTTLVDTGSTTDMMDEAYVLEQQTSRIEKTWRGFDVVEYRVPVTAPSGMPFPTLVRDYAMDLDLTIGGERIELLIGHPHERFVFNLVDNRLAIDPCVDSCAE